MRLRDLDAKLVKRWTTDNGEGWEPAESLAEADGLFYLCPKCFTDNNGALGTHGVLNWFVGKVPDDVKPLPGRWNPAGNGIDDITFIGPGSTSVLLQAGCAAHYFVRNGEIVGC